MYLCVYVWMHACVEPHMYVCVHVWMHACLCVRVKKFYSTYVCMYVRTCICMDACTCVRVCEEVLLCAKRVSGCMCTCIDACVSISYKSGVREPRSHIRENICKVICMGVYMHVRYRYTPFLYVTMMSVFLSACVHMQHDESMMRVEKTRKIRLRISARWCIYTFVYVYVPLNGCRYDFTHRM
jgi:hypothetical protein